MESLSNAVKQRIINLASERKITVHKLTLNSGVPYSTISSFLNGKCDSITLTTLLHICEGTEITLKDFFDDPLFNSFNKSKSSSNSKKSKKSSSKVR